MEARALSLEHAARKKTARVNGASGGGPAAQGAPSETGKGPGRGHRTIRPGESLSIVTSRRQYDEVFVPAGNRVGKEVVLDPQDLLAAVRRSRAASAAAGNVVDTSPSVPAVKLSINSPDGRPGLESLDQEVRRFQKPYFRSLGVTGPARAAGLHPEMLDPEYSSDRITAWMNQPQVVRRQQAIEAAARRANQPGARATTKK